MYTKSVVVPTQFVGKVKDKDLKVFLMVDIENGALIKQFLTFADYRTFDFDKYCKNSKTLKVLEVDFDTDEKDITHVKAVREMGDVKITIDGKKGA